MGALFSAIDTGLAGATDAILVVAAILAVLLGISWLEGDL